MLTSDEQRITSKDHLLIAVLHEVADAVLSVTRRMQRRHFNAVANLECFLVLWCLADFGTILTTDYGDLV